MTSLTRTRKPVQPVSGSARWLRRPLLPLGLGRLRISTAAGVSHEYDVGAHLDETGHVIGWRLVKDDDEGYDVDISTAPWSCSCPDYTLRRSNSPHTCKHAAGLRMALAALRKGVA
jgi:hypothetical protein